MSGYNARSKGWPKSLVIIYAGLVAILAYLAGQYYENQNPTVAVQMYVMAVDEGADVEQYKIEQAGDQFTYQLPEHVLQNIQQSPSFVDCIDGLAISSIWTQFAEQVTCDAPSIRVVLIAPY